MKSKVVEITEEHPLYKIKDNEYTTSRCSVEIDVNTPSDIARVIAQAWDMGYIKCNVYFTEQELTLLGLNNED